MKRELSDDCLYNLIYDNECELLKSEVRKSPEKISELITDDFIEFTSSGRVFVYESGEVFQKTDDDTELNWEIKNFNIKKLSNECILATFKVIKHDEIVGSKKYSLRSSVWMLLNSRWKMVFHQGTLTSRF